MSDDNSITNDSAYRAQPVDGYDLSLIAYTSAAGVETFVGNTFLDLDDRVQEVIYSHRQLTSFYARRSWAAASADEFLAYVLSMSADARALHEKGPEYRGAGVFRERVVDALAAALSKNDGFRRAVVFQRGLDLSDFEGDERLVGMLTRDRFILRDVVRRLETDQKAARFLERKMRAFSATSDQAVRALRAEQVGQIPSSPGL